MSKRLFCIKSLLRTAPALLAVFIALYPPIVHAQEYSSPDDEMVFTESQNDYAAKKFVTEQNKILNDVQFLISELNQKYDEVLPTLGERRIQELKEATQLPETTVLNRSRKANRLQNLGYERYRHLDWNSAEAQLEIGANVYEERTLKGEKIEEFSVYAEGFGKAQPTSIDGVIIPRVVHEETGIAFLLFPNSLSFESKHLQRYIDRIRIQSNRGLGRPVVLLAVNSSEIDLSNGDLKYRFFDRPKTFKEKAKAWWSANYIGPTRSSATITGISLIFQVGTTEGISAAKAYLEGAPDWSHTPTYLTAGFATVFGLWGSFYSNITAAKDPTDRASRDIAAFKRMLISSATFAYALQMLGPEGVQSVSLLTAGGWLTNLALWGNIVANNMTKDQWKMFNDIREDMGVSRGKVKILGTPVNRNQLERDVTGQGSRILKMLDLMKFDVKVMGSNLAIGSWLFYSSYIWTQYLVVKYAEKNDYAKKEKLRELWEKSPGKKFLNLPLSVAKAIVSPSAANLKEAAALPKMFVDSVLNNTRKFAKYMKSSCDHLMQGRSKIQEDNSPMPFTQSQDQWMRIGQ